MVEKHISCNRKLEGNIIILDNYDGAENLKNAKSKTGIVSYNSQMFSSSTMDSGSSPAESFNILTWQQVVGTEKFQNIIPAINDIFKCKRDIMNDENELVSGCKVYLYEMHVGKMLYNLTQYSLYNRKNFPHLLCKFHRGDGVKYREHECIQLTHDEHCHYYDRSIRRWTRKRESVGEDNYNMSQHRDWVDKENVGITHFGLHPTKMKLENIRFDTFHLISAVTKKLMTYLRKFIFEQSCELIDMFDSNVLSKVWVEYPKFVWNLNKTFQASLENNSRCLIQTFHT